MFKKGGAKDPENPDPTLKFREETIPVIVVNGVFYPSQRLRFKLHDPNMNLCNVPRDPFSRKLQRAVLRDSEPKERLRRVLLYDRHRCARARSGILLYDDVLKELRRVPGGGHPALQNHEGPLDPNLPADSDVRRLDL